MKYIVLFLILINSYSQKANAGLFDWEYFEPAAGCVAAGALGYVSASEGNEMKNAAIYCAVVGGVLFVINSHYENKYGDEFIPQETYKMERLQSFDLLERQNKSQANDLYFKRHQRLVPPKIDSKGQGHGPRIHETLKLDSKEDMVGM